MDKLAEAAKKSELLPAVVGSMGVIVMLIVLAGVYGPKR
jgi:hypothetical protein